MNSSALINSLKAKVRLTKSINQENTDFVDMIKLVALFWWSEWNWTWNCWWKLEIYHLYDRKRNQTSCRSKYLMNNPETYQLLLFTIEEKWQNLMKFPKKEWRNSCLLWMIIILKLFQHFMYLEQALSIELYGNFQLICIKRTE